MVVEESAKAAGRGLEAVGLGGVAADRRPETSQRHSLTKGRRIPERTCVACGKKLSKRELIRIVRTPEGAVTVDRTGKMPGRGAYLCWSEGCWTRGTTKGGLERSLKINLSVQDSAQLLAFYDTETTGSSSEAN